MTTTELCQLTRDNTLAIAALRECQRQTDRQLKQTFEQLRRRFAATDAQLKRRSAATDAELKQTDRQLRRLETLFTGQWGKLVESLVEGNLVELLRARGIQVEATFTRAKRLLKGRETEIDIIAQNGTELVAVEVKSTLAPEDVVRFVAKLRTFRRAFPEFRDKTLYGAVAYLRVDGDADRSAYRLGLFVIRATGNSAVITNDAEFRPVAW
jgi:hypothetical protein